MTPQKIWYHGGGRIHDWAHVRWDRDRTTSDMNAQGPGMYFTTDLEEANSYAHGASDPVVYTAVMRPGFRQLKGKATMPFLQALYDYAPQERQENFLSNWGLEWPATPREVQQQALLPYSGQDSALDAAVTLFHDLYQYDADEYVSTLQAMNLDGAVIPKGTTGGSRRREHLVLWNIRAVDLGEVS